MNHSRKLLWMILLLLAVAACGGGDEGADDNGGNTPTPEANNGDSGSDDEGGSLSLGGDIPDFFPSDFYLPEGLNVRGVSENPAADMISLTGIFESGDAAEIHAEAVAGFSFLTRFDSISKGVVALRDLVFFLSLIGAALAATGIVIDLKKAG